VRAETKHFYSLTDTTIVRQYLDQSKQAGKFPEKISYAKKAVELADSLDELSLMVEGRISLAEILAREEPDSSFSILREAKRTVVRKSENEDLADLLIKIGVSLNITGQRDSAIEVLNEGYETALQNDQTKTAGIGAYWLSYANVYRGQYTEAYEWAVRSERHLSEENLKNELSRTLTILGFLNDINGIYSRAIEYYLQSLNLARETGDKRALFRASNNLGIINRRIEDYEEAEEYYLEALELADQLDMEEAKLAIYNNLAVLYNIQDQYGEAIEKIQQALKLPIVLEDPCKSLASIQNLGFYYLKNNQVDSAQLYLTRALALADSCQNDFARSFITRTLGELYQKKQDLDKASESFLRALDIARKNNFPEDEKEALKALYLIAKSRKNAIESLSYLEKYQVLSDTLNKRDETSKAKRVAAEYDFQREVAAIESEKITREVELSNEIEAKNTESRLYLIFAIVLVIIAALLARLSYVIKRKNKQLHQMNEQKNKLIGIVSHDLRNPVHNVLGLTAAVQSAVSKQEIDESLEMLSLLEKTGNQMSRLIDRILDISKIENMKSKFQLKQVDIISVTMNSIANFQSRAMQKGIVMETQFNPSQSLTVNADAEYLEQAIDNLLSNAIKFSDTADKVAVDAYSVEASNIIKVQDFGPGIKREEQQKIFQSYSTTSIKPTGDEKSTGLGLAIAYDFITEMGGTLSLESSEGEGTTFYISFPAVKE
jgi:signal transduction histidine kinase/Tfp pilus assembly protein PilF